MKRIKMKLYSIVFHEDVALDYNEAYIWYEGQQKGLGETFLIEVNDKIQQIKSSPDSYGIKSRPGYHEAIIAKFPYSIVYRLYKKQNTILITSVHHHKKHPRKKYRE
jgi:mRNA-degrading endonuclease RelE of RelBE toxin-antitoxin system